MLRWCPHGTTGWKAVCGVVRLCAVALPGVLPDNRSAGEGDDTRGDPKDPALLALEEVFVDERHVTLQSNRAVGVTDHQLEELHQLNGARHLVTVSAVATVGRSGLGELELQLIYMIPLHHHRNENLEDGEDVFGLLVAPCEGERAVFAEETNSRLGGSVGTGEVRQVAVHVNVVHIRYHPFGMDHKTGMCNSTPVHT